MSKTAKRARSVSAPVKIADQIQVVGLQSVRCGQELGTTKIASDYRRVSICKTRNKSVIDRPAFHGPYMVARLHHTRTCRTAGDWCL